MGIPSRRSAQRLQPSPRLRDKADSSLRRSGKREEDEPRAQGMSLTVGSDMVRVRTRSLSAHRKETVVAEPVVVEKFFDFI